MGKDVREALEQVLGNSGDDTIFDYCISMLEDEDFEWGEDAEDAFDALGPFLVGAGCVPDDAAAHEACRKLQNLLDPSSTPAAATTNGTNNDSANGTAADLTTTKPKSSSSFRALDGGPILLNEMNKVSLHPSDSFSAKHLIQGAFREGEEEGFSLMTEKDIAKIRRQQEKQDRIQRAAYLQHVEAASATLTGHQITVVRNTGGPAVRDIHLPNISVSNGGAELIADADVVLAFGRRYGLVGRNGTGKTTFLRALANRELKGIPANCQVLHVEQEVTGDDTTVLQAVLDCDTERTQLLAEEARLLALLGNTTTTTVAAGDSDESNTNTTVNAPTAASEAASNDAALIEAAKQLENVSKKLLEIDADGAESRAAAILAGLSFDADMQNRPTKTFSGGWRMRVALARALFVQPDLLLLDEPTNHLDLHAVLWLQEYLLKWPKTVITVSHAREFLNTVCTDILHLHSQTLTPYRGNYDVFEKTMHERTKNAKAAAESQENKRKHMQAFIDRFRYNANRAALVQSRIKALQRMAEVSLVADDPEYRFAFPTPEDVVSPPVISFNDVDFGYPGSKQLFHNLNFGIDCESRMAIVGPNGIGKSTLLGLISGTLEPTKGHIYRNPKVRLAIFSQHHVDGLDLALTPLRYFAKCFPDAKDPQHRSHLASFGVDADLANQAMYTLSGGQKSRVALARVTWHKPHILLLDEPSNHLDIDAVDALIQGLAAFKGGVLMVSHDQYLIEATVDELWAVENGTVTVFHGTFEEYKKRLEKLRLL